MKAKEGFLLRQVGTNYVLVPVGQAAADFSNIITLNETGAFIWKRLEQGKTLDEIAADIAKEYEIDLSRAKSDVEKYCRSLLSKELIEE